MMLFLFELNSPMSSNAPCMVLRRILTPHGTCHAVGWLYLCPPPHDAFHHHPKICPSYFHFENLQ